MEQRPEYTMALIRKFIDGPPIAHTVANGEEMCTVEAGNHESEWHQNWKVL
jgi:hypothetical protein